MRILITNDDGIHSEGLRIAEGIAHEILGESEGEVYVVAPASEQSGVSHAISYHRPVNYAKISDRRYVVEGTPADCVIIGVTSFMDEKPDLILSGVNFGHNIAEDVIYSGTVGGAIQGTLQGIRSIALSQAYKKQENHSGSAHRESGKECRGEASVWECSVAFGASVIRDLLSNNRGREWPVDGFYNVNFPAVSVEDAASARFVAQGKRAQGIMRAVREINPNGKPVQWLVHDFDNDTAPKETDCYLLSCGHITITPMHSDLTLMKTMKYLGEGL
jgi:5'-nucleotidase